MTNYIGINKTKSPIQRALGRSNFTMLANGETRKSIQDIIIEFLEECKWDKEIIKRELPKL